MNFQDTKIEAKKNQFQFERISKLSGRLKHLFFLPWVNSKPKA